MIVNPGIRRFLGSAIQRLFNSASFYAPLTHSLVLERGTGSPTFTRATTSTWPNNDGYMVTGVAGEIGFVGARRVRNLLTFTEDFSNAVWVASNVTKANGVSDPLGTTRAGTLTATANNGLVYQAVTPPSATGYVAVNSIYIRRRTGTGAIYFRTANNVDVDVTSSVTTDWTRISSAPAAPASGTWYFVLKLATSGDAIDIAFPQLEDVTAQTTQTAGEYVSVGVESAPYYHGSMVDGVKCYATDINGAAIPSTTLLGYQAEGARTNLVWPSEDLTHVRYVSGGGGIAVVADQAVAPDGTTTADQLTASGANGTLIQDLGVIASAAQAFSIYLKRKTGTGNIDITLDGGATWTTQAITTTEWTRCQITQTVANPDVGIRIVTSGDAIYAWGLQCE